MKRELHLGINALLRGEMTAYLNRPSGRWGLHGCYQDAPDAKWVSLDGIEQALTARVRERSGQGHATVAQLRAAVEHLAAAMPADRYGTETTRLCGIAIITVSDDGDRVCRAEAVFDDERLHIAIWRACEPAPLWEVFEPDQAASVLQYRSAGSMLPGLLAALHRGGPEAMLPVWAGRFDRERHARLNAELRCLLADRLTVEDLNVLFGVHFDSGRWKITPIAGVNESIAAHQAMGMSIREALDELADDLEYQPAGRDSQLQGVAMHLYAYVDNSRAQAFAAWCDSTLHLMAWSVDYAAPIWQVIPAGAVDDDMRWYTELLARIHTALTGQTNH